MNGRGVRLIGLLSLTVSACSVAPLPLPTPTTAATERAPTPVPTVTLIPSIAPTERRPEPSATPPSASAPPETPTAEPAGAPTGGALLFEYAFDSAGVWGVEDVESHRIAVAGGVMSITVKQTDWAAWTFAGRKASDFYAEVSAAATNCSQDDSYGMLFRVVDTDNFYLFGLGCGARYRVRHRQDGEWNELVDWTPAEGIDTGDGVENRLGVRAVGDGFRFYVNGTHLADTADSSFVEGQFGLFAQSSLAAGLSANFDNLQVRAATP